MGASWTQSLREEFKVQKLHLITSKPEVLLQPQWDIPPLLWLLYRCFMLVYTVSWCIYTALVFNTPKFLIFLSHISYCLMVLYYLVALFNLAWAFLQVYLFHKRRGVSTESRALPSLPACLTAALCLQWLLHAVVGCVSLNVSFVYWTINYSSAQHSFTAFSINLHVINSLQTIVDLLLSSTPVHLLHYCYALVTGLLYIIFAFVYWLTGCTNLKGQHYIYSVLDFSERPLMATLCIVSVCLLYLPLSHFVLWNLQHLREMMVRGERGRRMVIKREVWWWVKVPGGSDFDSVPSVEGTGSVFETTRKKTRTEQHQSQALTNV